jgi:hypothetical protein
MFGGVAFFLNGNMCVGVHKSDLIARVGELAATPLQRCAHVRAMDITGRPMKGWILVEPSGLKRTTELLRYVDAAAEFVATLPQK